MARMASMVRLPLLASALLVGLACAKDNTLARTPPMVRPRCSAPSPAAEHRRAAASSESEGPQQQQQQQRAATQPQQQPAAARRAALPDMLAPARGAVT
jgi:hypothetical protein